MTVPAGVTIPPVMAGRRVRANPAYRLVQVSELSATSRARQHLSGSDADGVVGVLMANGRPGLADQALDGPATQAWRHLQRPAEVSVTDAQHVLGLVLDGVLQVEDDDGFVTGPRALEQLNLDALLPSAAPDDVLTRLSRDALGYADRLRLPDVDQTTARLYAYHRIPLSGRWARTFSREEVARLLGSPSDGWMRSVTRGWLMYRRRDDDPPLLTQPLPYKLYVSVAVKDLPDVLGRVLTVMTAGPVSVFKIGGDAAGLLRPDKIVAYLPDAASVTATARLLRDAYPDVKAHGVPFTAALTDDGLLSWGGDPSPGTGPLGRPVESWRLSVSRRLAHALHTAWATPPTKLGPVDYALARVCLDGVDVTRFAPSTLDNPGQP